MTYCEYHHETFDRMRRIALVTFLSLIVVNTLQANNIWEAFSKIVVGLALLGIWLMLSYVYG